MTRDDLLWILNAFLDGTSQTDDLVFKAELMVEWLENQSNCIRHDNYQEEEHEGWLLT